MNLSIVTLSAIFDFAGNILIITVNRRKSHLLEGIEKIRFCYNGN